MSLNHLSDSSVAGNVDTDFVVPASHQRKILYGHVVYTADANAADRRVKVQVVDESSNIVFDTHAGDVVTANESDMHHEMMPGIYRETAFVGSALQVPIPKDFRLDAGYTLRVTIENGLAGDSYDVNWIAEDIHHGAQSIH